MPRRCEKAADRFDGDPDVQTLFADAQMNTMPWDYWQKDGTPKPETARVLEIARAALLRDSLTMQGHCTTTSTCSRLRPIPTGQQRAPIVSAR